MTLPAHPPSDALKSRLSALLDELIRHDGFGSLSVEVRLLKRGQKEVIIDCGKQFRQRCCAWYLLHSANFVLLKNPLECH